MKSELIPLNGDPPLPIDRDVTVVGRREFCDVVVEHPSLSKRHCVLVRTDGLLIVRDLISTNGTKVNGQRVMWAALLPNDRLTLGRVKYKVYLGPDDVPSPSERHREQAVARVAASAGGGGMPASAAASGAAADPMRRPGASGFPAPSPLSMPALVSPAETTAPTKGSTDPDAEFEPIPDSDFDVLDDAGLDILDDDDEIIELE
jgi:pSer/pThr/pTyr-binding forkhead associated (FHA) protein